MHNHLKQLAKDAKRQPDFRQKIKLRQHLNADAMFANLRHEFSKIPDHRQGSVEIPLQDALMSGFAMFSLKIPSLLAFDKRRKEEPHNLRTIYGIGQIPCDTQMRTILDPVPPASLRPTFRSLFRAVQRGKALEQMVFLEDHYLLNMDGTGIYSSAKVSSPYCLKKVLSNGQELYYQMMLGAAIVHPDFKEVIPLCPEMIVKQDGAKKQDCEQNAAKRFFSDLRREHPHLKLIVNEDALSPNAPHIRELQKNDLRFLLVVKPDDHVFLFDQVKAAAKAGKTSEFSMPGPHHPKILLYFRFINGVALNRSNPDLLVNFLRYWELDANGKTREWCWITDLTITEKNAYQLMRGGRARWKIENETFNTLKNQGYNLEHNFGLGKKHLSAVFALLAMLAFLVDQIQQLCCPLFKAAWEKCESKRELWEAIRALFRNFIIETMEHLYRALLDWKPLRLPESPG